MRYRGLILENDGLYTTSCKVRYEGVYRMVQTFEASSFVDPSQPLPTHRTS